MDGKWCPQLEFGAHSALLRLGKPWNGGTDPCRCTPDQPHGLEGWKSSKPTGPSSPPFVPSEFRRNLLPVHSLLPVTSVAVFEPIPQDLVPIGHHEC